MNYGLKEQAGLFWKHCSAPSEGTKEFQNDRFSIICIEEDGKKGKEVKEGWEDRQEEME